MEEQNQGQEFQSQQQGQLNQQQSQGQMNKQQKGKKSSLLLILLLLLVAITIGYAALSTTLKIQGESKIVNGEWCVGPKCGDNACEDITDPSCTNPPITCPSGTNCTILDCDANPETCETIPTPTADNPVIWLDGDTIYFKHVLEKPGDVFTFNTVFTNGGNIDAKVQNVTKSALNSTAQDYMTYDVTYGNNTAIQQDDVLAAGSSATFKVTVTYKSSVTELPNAETLALINETAQGHDGATSLFTVIYEQN